MAMRVYGLPVLYSPPEVFGAAAAVLGWSEDVIVLIGGMPRRIDRMLDEVERTVTTLNLLLERVERASAQAEQVTTGAGLITSRATLPVRALVPASGIDGYLPLAQNAAQHAVLTAGQTAGPIARQVVDGLTPSEVRVAAQIIGPQLRIGDRLGATVGPLVGSLERVGPDLQQLLAAAQEAGATVFAIPRLRLLRRRD